MSKYYFIINKRMQYALVIAENKEVATDAFKYEFPLVYFDITSEEPGGILIETITQRQTN